jgi:hypothetical protein
MSNVPIWIQYLQALSTPAIALLAATIGVLQWRTAHQRAVLDLFDRRMENYDALNAAMQPRFCYENSQQRSQLFKQCIFCEQTLDSQPRSFQSSSGRWTSLKSLVVFDLSMTLWQTTHVAASPSLLGTSEGVVEYRAPQCGQKKARPSRTGPT